MKSIIWSSLTYIVTFFSIGWYTQPAGPAGLVLYVGVPLAFVALFAAALAFGRLMTEDW